MPLVSVIVPVYNVRAYLSRCVDSLLNQTYQNIEVLLIDDGSTDGSSMLCDGKAANDSRVRVVHSLHRGVSSARNIGLKAASGEYLMFVDADDHLEPEGIEFMMGSVTSASTDACICDSYFRGSMVRNLPHFVVNVGRIQGKAALAEHLRLRFGSGLWLFLFRREVVSDLYFNENIHQMEDWEFLVKALDRMRDLSVLHTPVYHNEIREGSASSTPVDERVLTCLSISAEAKSYFQGRDPVPGPWDTYVRVRMLIKLLGMAALRGVADGSHECLLRQVARDDLRVVLRSNDFGAREKLVVMLAAGSPTLVYGWYRLRARIA